MSRAGEEVFAWERKRVRVLMHPLGCAQLRKAAGLAGARGDTARAAFSKLFALSSPLGSESFP